MSRDSCSATGQSSDEVELERARLHGPDVRTIDALKNALDRVAAAERDFIQVHKNCIEARARAEKAEASLSGFGVGVTDAVAKGDYGAAYGLQIDHEMASVPSAIERTPTLQWQPIDSYTPFKNEPLIVLTDEGNICGANQYCGHWNMPMSYQDDRPVAWIPMPKAKE